MSKSKISWSKNSFLKIAKVFLIAITIVTIVGPNKISAANTTEYKYFIVKKEWEGDLTSKRPTEVKIHIESIDGSYAKDETLSASEGWEKGFYVPAYDNSGEEIIYSVYEKEEGLEEYDLSNPSKHKIIISEANKNCIVTGIGGGSSEEVVTPYDLIKDTDSFYDAPYGNVLINTNLLLKDADIKLSEGFSYSENTERYYDPFNGNKHAGAPTILYTGNLNEGNNPIEGGSIELTWEDKAVDTITNKTYDVKVIVDNITIFAVNSAEDKTVSVMSNSNGLLEMESFVTSPSDDKYDYVIGVAADIQIKLVGAPANTYAQMYVTDLDVGDYASGYYEAKTKGSSDPESYVTHKIDDPYVEGVELKRGIASSIYITGDSRLITITEGDNKNSRYIDGVGTTDVNSVKNSLKYLAEVGDVENSYKYRWTGSKCETAIITLGKFPGEYTNTITNKSSLYRVQYFYQLDNGEYPTTPDVPKTEEEILASLVMVKPGTEVSVNENAETDPTKVDSTKKNYILDSDQTDVMEVKTTSSSAETVLNVYFKKDCVVIYHDNFNDELWNPSEQTYNHLNLNDPTPIYQKGDTKKIPENIGYEFIGWSEIDYEKWKEDGTDVGPKFEPFGNVEPANISKPETHYLAHWEALPNQYTVQYFYEVDGAYPVKPDYELKEPRKDKKSGEIATIIESDKIPNPEKPNYYLNTGMTSEWSKTVKGDGSTILKVYFKQKAETIKIPVTGVE